MTRTPKLIFDRGTLTIHPPPRGKGWIDYAVWDDRVEKFRIPAIYYPFLIECLQLEKVDFVDEATIFHPLKLVPTLEMPPYLHQQEALTAWKQGGSRGVVVLPTASGKTYLAQLAMEAIAYSTLVVVPTLDLMHQWYAHLVAAFPDADIGLLGGGSRDKTSILVATYDSATLQAENLGNRYGLLVFDECHHLPTDFYRVIAEYAIAPYRLGLTATPDRSDGRHSDLNHLIGPTVYHRTPEQLAGVALADHDIVEIKVKLSQQERDRYQEFIKVRNNFLKNNNIRLGSLDGWKQFIMVSARSANGRQAMLAHRQAKEIALCTDGKLRILADILSQHHPERTLIFTADNTTVYRISQDFLIPAITHQTPVKERHKILDKFRQGDYRTLVASHVLNEGVDVPDAKIAIILSGTGSEREYIQRLGRVLRKGTQTGKRAVLYEVITENTSEEQTSQRRRGKQHPQQLEIVTPTPLYDTERSATSKVAESSEPWDSKNSD